MQSASTFAINKPMLFAIGGLVSALHLGIAGFATAVGIFGRGFSADPTTNYLLVTGIFLFSIVSLLVTLWYSHKAYRTKITELGVGQPTLRGWVQLNWTDIAHVKLKEHNGLRLSGPPGNVVIALGVFRNREKALAFLLGHLSAHGKV